MSPDTITFMSKTDKNNETVMLTAETADLNEVIEVFERFLRGAGWVFDGHLELVQKITLSDKPF